MTAAAVDTEALFEGWKQRVDALIHRVARVPCDDLPDFRYREAFDAYRSPAEVAYDVLKREGFYE